MGKKYKEPGIFLTRELYTSKAFLSLKAGSIKILLILYGKRIPEKNSQAKGKKGDKRKRGFVNDDSLYLTYLHLEKDHKIPRKTIARAFDELLEKGFITLVYQGGTYHHDKNRYAVSENYLIWQPGMIFQVRPKDKLQRGYRNQENNSRGQIDTPTHGQNDTPN